VNEESVKREGLEMIATMDETTIEEDEAYPKFLELKRILEARSAIISFSGGVDSTFLAFVARWVCGRSLAVTADSPTLAPGELDEAKRLAGEIGIEHRIVSYDELQDPDFAKNPEDRCYFCKRGLMDNLLQISAREGFDLILEGTNASDMSGHRPGRRAVSEAGVCSPLLEAGLVKKEVRRFSRVFGLPTWDKPSMACLASRVPYHSPITHERLRKIGEAERLLRNLGFDTVRVRDHDGVARIEVDRARIGDLIDADMCQSVVEGFRALGFTHVTVDLLGYRTGSMNESAQAS
jgi:uncharacterized protein